jgi:hypothetical protein
MNRTRGGDHDIPERVRTELRNALDKDDPSEKDYHVRTALQDLLLSEEFGCR